ncbi:condensation domain-containing protein [Robinsoniella sp.]|uniref:condensation domain-containing protein n=1 Tax=Robinsoniella sp. TaxID=2496533 RepID=UPI003753187C
MNESDVNLNKMTQQDIAVVGIGARFPNAESVDEYWENLTNGVDCIGEVPLKRKEFTAAYLRSKDVCFQEAGFPRAGYLECIDEFDYEFFGISPTEAKLMNPNQRIFLEVAWAAMEDAGYSQDKVKGQNIGVYTGFIGENNYERLIQDICPELLPSSVTGNCTPMVASRVSYQFDLKGPNMIINTSCSSSLTAIHLACQGIRNGECEAAIAGGVQVYPLTYRELLIGVESPDGRSKPFDNDANGTGIGEGAGAVVLKSLCQALKEGDVIYAVIKGSAVNQDGTSIGISAPNPCAQAEVLQKAWETAGIDPLNISYIEAHGTGTKLGDPIEIDGIKRAFSKYTSKKKFCAIGSVKSNIGHLDGAAGIAGFIKAVLCIKNHKIPPTLHYKSPNQNIDFEDTPVFINNKLLEWESKGYPNLCGVSSFGISGTNCHVVLEEFTGNDLMFHETENNTSQNQIFTISAKTEQALFRIIESYVKFLETKATLNEICFSTYKNRSHYKVKLAIACTDKKILKEKLLMLLEQGLGNYPEQDIYYTKASQITTNWNNANIQEYYCPNLRIHLPPYSFEKSKCWLDKPRNLGLVTDNHNFEINQKSDKSLTTDITAVKLQITNLFTNVLGFTDISENDDFFSFGGDSISSLSVINVINSKYNIDIDQEEFSDNATIEQLTNLILKKLQNISLLTCYEKTEPHEKYPASSAQKRIYISSKFKNNSTDYNILSAYIIAGELNINKLERAFKSVIDRHEALRTNFVIEEDTIVQIIHQNINFNLVYETKPDFNLLKEAQKYNKVFNLESGPLINVNLIQYEKKKYYLITNIHHIVTDGISNNIIMDEIIKFYGDLPIENNFLNYKDFSEWQNRCIQDGLYKKHEEYWINKLTPYLTYAKEKEDLREVESGSKTLFLKLDTKLYKALIDYCKNSKITLFMLLLSGYMILIHRYMRKNLLTVGIVLSGRNRPEYVGTIGVFVNTLPIVATISGRETLKDILMQVKQNATEAYAHQEYPLEILVEQLGLQGSEFPLFDNVIVLQNYPKTKFDIDKAKISYCELEDTSSKYNQLVNCYECDNSITISLNYSKDINQAENMEYYLKDFVYILEQITISHDTRVDNIKISQPNRICMSKNRKVPDREVSD